MRNTLQAPATHNFNHSRGSHQCKISRGKHRWCRFLEGLSTCQKQTNDTLPPSSGKQQGPQCPFYCFSISTGETRGPHDETPPLLLSPLSSELYLYFQIRPKNCNNCRECEGLGGWSRKRYDQERQSSTTSFAGWQLGRVVREETFLTAGTIHLVCMGCCNKTLGTLIGKYIFT